MEKIWLKHTPPACRPRSTIDQYPSLVALLEESFRKYRDLPAYRFMGKDDHASAQVDDLSRAFAAYLQGLGLARGDRVAIMMPNVPQYPVAVAAILRAGLVVVNVNPLYTPRELEHQLKDSGAKAIVIVENFAATLQQVIDAVPTKKVVLAAMGDMLGLLKGALVNHVVRKVKKMVPPFSLPGAVRFNDAVAQGRGKTFTRAAGRARRHRGAAVHRRHHRRQQGRGAAAPQPGGQHPAGRGLVPAGAEEDPGRRADRHRLRAAAVSHLRLQHEHDAGACAWAAATS